MDGGLQGEGVNDQQRNIMPLAQNASGPENKRTSCLLGELATCCCFCTKSWVENPTRGPD